MAQDLSLPVGRSDITPETHLSQENLGKSILLPGVQLKVRQRWLVAAVNALSPENGHLTLPTLLTSI